MKKIITIVGARPQFIKAGILSKQLRKKFNEVLVHTGQHYDKNMSDVFFDELDIPKPDYNLGIGSGSHAQQTAKMMMAIERVLLEEKPDAVLLYGDTNSTAAGALTAAKLQVPVFHVEGGVRTHFFDMPEEQNRIVTDHLSSLIFVSTKENLEEAEREGLKEKTFLVGDVMYDSLLYYTEKAETDSFENHIHRLVPLYERKEVEKKYYICTMHRPENTDNIEKLKEVLSALDSLEHLVIFSVHPRIRSKIDKLHTSYKNIYFVEPLAYHEVLYFTKHAEKVVTDSGGLHKEAYLHGTPCVTVLRNGWKETIHDGWNYFVRPERKQIVNAVNDMDIDWSCSRNEFGDGKSCEKIVEIIDKYFKED